MIALPKAVFDWGVEMANSVAIMRALDNSKMTARMAAVFLIAAVSYFTELYSVGSIASVLPIFIKTFHLNGVSTGLIITMAGVGAVVGAILSGAMTDLLGRRYLFVLSTVIYAVGSIISAYANDYTTLLLGRVIDGFGAGAITPVILTYVTEFVPAKLRSVLIPGAVVFSVVSIPAAPYIAYYTIPTLSYRGVFLVGGIIGILLALVSFALLPESIRYLLKKNRVEKAEKLARRIVTPEAMANAERMVASMPEGSRQLAERKSSWKDIFQRGYLKSTFGAYLIAICHGTAIFGLGAFATAVWTTYTHMFTLQQALLILAPLGLISPFGPIVTILGLNRFSRRRWLTMCYLLMTVSLGGIGYSLAVKNPTALIGFTGLNNLVATMSFSSLATYSTEIFPTAARGMGTGFVQGINRFGGVYAPIIFGVYIVTAYANVYLFAAVLAFAAMVLVVATAHETRNKSLEKIESEFKGEVFVAGSDEN